MPAAWGCTTSSPGLSVQTLRCCSLLCFRFDFLGLVPVSAFCSAAMVSPSIGIRGAARWRIENHSLQRDRADLFQNRLPPNERSPDTGAILSIGHASAIGSSALAAAPLSLDSHSGTPKFPTLTTHPKGVQYC